MEGTVTGMGKNLAKHSSNYAFSNHVKGTLFISTVKSKKHRGSAYSDNLTFDG